ncbi:DUF4377 domain-containing protein [Psychrobacter urativorans]|uniref:DUF4377 domain-containing protein n=1 Tax=Psychrobacter urativorans TaxID=45610 RepID=A0A0M5MJQ4_9GAMM|nr:DUF4377 domain-containing protein [Psychrobacter urativorans]ALF58755.1 hypothetical protein AOC03_00740 [Psychrobacter urativorans]
MKKLAIAALVTTFTVAGCSTMKLNDERAMVVEGEAVKVKVVNIPSFQVEIAPRKAVCQVTDTGGTVVEAQCLQYRQTYQKNYNTLNGNIQGFTYEPNYRYVLDVRQEAVADTASGVVRPLWFLNSIVSKTAE